MLGLLTSLFEDEAAHGVCNDDDRNLADTVHREFHAVQQIYREIVDLGRGLLLSGGKLCIVPKCQDARRLQARLIGQPQFRPEVVEVAVLTPGPETRAAEAMDEDNIDGTRLSLGLVEDGDSEGI